MKYLWFECISRGLVYVMFMICCVCNIIVYLTKIINFDSLHGIRIGKDHGRYVV